MIRESLESPVFLLVTAAFAINDVAINDVVTHSYYAALGSVVGFIVIRGTLFLTRRTPCRDRVG
jgi:uncharacterized membrane protein